MIIEENDYRENILGGENLLAIVTLTFFLVSEECVASPSGTRRGMVTRGAKAAETRRWTAH